MKINSTTIIIIVSILIAVGIVGFAVYSRTAKTADPALVAFASCLKDKGAVFYGTFWCPHCQNQKALFGRAAKYLPYVECSNPDESQNEVCKAKDIKGYPTWRFTNGNEKVQEMTISELSLETGCVLQTASLTPLSTSTSSI